MELRNLGHSGLRVSAIGLGCNNFGARIDDAAAKAVIHKAMDLGITLFDTADIYGNKGGSETTMGGILGARRKDIVLASKFGMQMDEAGVMKGGARRYIMSAVEASLKRLKTDWLDLYQLHQPDPLTPIEETLRTLDDLVRSGKVRYIGCSNLAGWQVADAQWTSRHNGLASFISAQDEYSLLFRDHEKQLFPALHHYGMGLLPYFPLACGMLTGKYERGKAMPAGSRLSTMKNRADQYMTDTNWAIVDKLAAFAKARGHTVLDLAMSWLAQRPPVTSVIAGATSAAQVEANVKAASWTLSADDMAEVARLASK
ncbi:MAG TPA: aldo/keto reductase [Hyphomicrobiaceae bacterium]|nr:aldo/keto reductase [Hyphomicrobiaceae bacterium]